jgi:murein peptide amidase A
MMFKSLTTITLLILLPLSPLKAEEYDERVKKECTRIGNKLGSVSTQDCLKINLIASDGRSVKNAPIMLKEYPPLEKRSPLGKVLLLGGIHGDEYSSVSIVFKWLRTLDTYHSGLFHWHVVPLLNPDGLLRKKSQRMNENNVDLNRNFPMDNWENTALKHWIDVTKNNVRRYPGEHALSEPESSWLVDQINEFNPDVIVAVHAPHGIVDYDGPHNGPYKLGRLHLNLLGTYPGSLGNYAGIQRKIPVVTIELPYAGIMPTAKEINDIWRDMVKWLTKNITEEAYIQSQKQNQDAAPS